LSLRLTNSSGNATASRHTSVGSSPTRLPRSHSHSGRCSLRIVHRPAAMPTVTHASANSSIRRNCSPELST
jgi:hypothetical protein